jgi:hypothetical protein
MMENHIYWSDPKEKELESEIISEYSPDEVRRHLEYLTTLTRMAGTEDERRAAEYIKGKLDEYGIDAKIHQFEAYISHPGKAELEMLSPVRKAFFSLAHGFIASTPPEGVEAELVSVGKGLEEDFRGVDVRSKIAVIEGGGGEDQFGAAEAARIAEENGAVGQIFISRGSPRSISYMRLRNAWGPPTPETMDKIPNTPAISICDEDGKYLRELAEKGRVVVRLKADAWRGYKKVQQPIGTVRGMKEPEKYLLFATHYCSWYIGATDNAAANSLLLEMARIFSKYRKGIARSIRFAWWTGHSQGSSAGSSWYADHFWDDIRDNGISYLLMDGLGRAGSSGFSAQTTEEVRKFYEGVIKQVLGLEVKSKRVSRSGDQSFWGIGLPSFTGSMPFTGPKGEKKVWYSHAAEDTLDKVDMDLLKIPFKVNAVSVLKVCNHPVLPFDFVTVLEAFKNALNELQGKCPSELDLTSLVTQVKELGEKTESLNKAIERNLLDVENKRKGLGLQKKFRLINGCLMELSHELMPALSTKSGKYGQDPMGKRSNLIPTLQPVSELISMDREGEEFKALLTSLLRERNKLSDVLRSARQNLDNTLREI